MIFKRLLFLTGLMFPSMVLAEESNTGRYIFAHSRFFGPKIGVDHISHEVGDHIASAKGLYSNLARHQYSYFKNISRTYKDVIGYGGWNKEYRRIIGFEYDHRKNDSGKSSYGGSDRSGNAFLITDKAFLNKKVRLGGGLIFSKYDAGYANSLAGYISDNMQAAMHLVYNDAEKGLRLRSSAYSGYGKNKLKRRIDSGGTKGDFDTYYYGLANTLTHTVSGDLFFFQSQAELNGFGVYNKKIKETGSPANDLTINSNEDFMWESVLEVFVGLSGQDIFKNNYSLKIGPSLTYILSDPYDSFYGVETNGNVMNFPSRRDQKDYITWKAYASYKLENNLGFFADLRYHNKHDANVSFALGINYSF